MAFDLGATLNVLSGALMGLLAVAVLLADPRKDWNRVFALFAFFWGAQIVAANAVRLLDHAGAARLAGEVSLAFLLPLYFFLVMFVAIFPRPRAPFGTRAFAVAALLVPAGVALALLFARTDLILLGVEATPQGGHTMRWGPLIPLVAVAPFYAAFAYALFVMQRRLDEAPSPIERTQVTFVLAAIGLFVAYSTPFQLLLFGSAALGLRPASTAGAQEARLIAAVMMASLVVLVLVARRLAKRSDARPMLAALGAAFVAGAASGTILLAGGPRVDLLGVVRIASVGLIVYAVARYQLFDIDLRVKNAAVAAAATLSALALAGVAWLLLRGTDVPLRTAVAAIAALVVLWPALRVAARLADRVAPAADSEGQLYLRKLEVYRAGVEQMLREQDEAREDDAWLVAQRERLGLSARDHAVATSLALSGAAPAAAPDLRPGGVAFGKYAIESLLAHGGYGRVFLARDRILGRAVVIKELQARWRADPSVARRFLDEARIAGALDHPNIVAVHAVEQHGLDHYIVMEHVAGGSLEAKLEGGPLAPAEAERIARDVLAALSAAHARGVVHRDVKPGNVLLNSRGAAKLADFGIAQMEQDAPERTISGLTTGPAPGTLSAMSPEQARGDPVGPTSDVYAVGALLHRMLTGRAHVDLAGLDEVAARARIARAEPPLRIDGAPARLATVVQRALARDPSARFQTADEMARALAVNPPVERA